VREEGVGSFARVPLGLGPRRFGVLTGCHPVEGALDEGRLALLRSLARPAAAAIAYALEFQHERRIAGALTRGYIPGAPLGVVDDVAFEAPELAFASQHLLFAATDGLIEARRGAELFGQERVTAIVAEHAGTLGTQALVERAYAEAEAFADALTDDVAIIALRPK